MKLPKQLQKLDAYGRARLRLTLLYFVSMFVIIVLFSALMIVHQTSQIDRFRQFGPRSGSKPVQMLLDPTSDLQFIQTPTGLKLIDVDSTASAVQGDFIRNVVISDVFLIAGLVALAYMLAGVALKPIKEALDQQKMFVADASHEFKTPLAVIRTEAEVLSRDKKASSDDYREFLASTIEEVDRMSALTTSLLYIAQSENVSASVRLADVDLVELAEKIVKKFTKLAQEKKLSIKLETKLISAKVVSDADQLEHVINILIDNAIKYNKENGSITVKISETAGKRQMIIEDTGQGIPKEHLSKIFNRFYRVSQDRNKKGFGLGLSIAKQICDQIDVKLGFKSVEGDGTIVILFFQPD
jgi:signal transduction histidine kinase